MDLADFHASIPGRRRRSPTERKDEMHLRISDLTIGQGTADGALGRIQSDLIPIYKAADGFVAYYAFKQAADSATTVRVFEDQATLDAATQAASAATDQIVNDFQITNTPHGGADADVAFAFAPVHTP
jgi:hypothetical protein